MQTGLYKMKTRIHVYIFLLLCLCNSFPAQNVNYYLIPNGNVTVLTDWNSAQNGTGTTPASFTLGDFWNIVNNSTVVLNSAWNLGVAEVVNVGDASTTLSFVLANGSSIGTEFINVFPSATLDVESNFPFSPFTSPVFNNGSTIIFGTNAPDMPHSTSYFDVVINDNTGLNGNTVIINGILTINAGYIFQLNGTLDIHGLVAGTGQMEGDPLQTFLTLSSAGYIGTLFFKPGFESIAELNLSLSNGDNVTLGTDLIVNGAAANFYSGGLELGAHSFIVGSNAAVNFFGGKIVGTSGSSLRIDASGINGPLVMDAGFNTLKTLVLNSSSGLLTIGNRLKITDSLSVLSGTLDANNNITLVSTSTLKSRIGRVGNSGSVTGSLTVETFLPGGTTGWANLGIGGIAGQHVSDWDTYFSSGAVNGIPMTCLGCYYGPAYTINWFKSIVAWDQALQQYDTTVYSASPLLPGKGFWVYVGDGQFGSNDLKLINTGAVVTGNIMIALSSGYNLVSNPYASPIAWSKVLDNSGVGINNAIYIWNADISGGASTSYVAGVSSHANGANNIIPAGQGFYVQALASTSLVFDEAVKVSNNTHLNPLLKSSASQAIGNIFRLKINGATDADQTAFRIHPEATGYFDPEWDAHKIFESPGYAGYPGPYSKYTTISSKDPANDDYSIQSVPPLTQDVKIPVLVKVSTSGTYTISAQETDDVHDCILLKDNLLNITTDLKGGSYNFTISDTTTSPRFELTVCRDSQLNPASVGELKQSGFIHISQDAEGAFVKTTFTENTKATISVYNSVGQKLTEDIKIEGTITNTYLNLDAHNQVVLIRVVSDKENSMKKMVLH